MGLLLDLIIGYYLVVICDYIIGSVSFVCLYVFPILSEINNIIVIIVIIIVIIIVVIFNQGRDPQAGTVAAWGLLGSLDKVTQHTHAHHALMVVEKPTIRPRNRRAASALIRINTEVVASSHLGAWPSSAP